MCLAIPMRVVSLVCEGQASEPTLALVESAGIRKEIRLDVVDRLPEPGDYVIVHAGFAMHSLSADEARKNLALLREMADALAREDSLAGDAEA